VDTSSYIYMKNEHVSTVISRHHLVLNTYHEVGVVRKVVIRMLPQNHIGVCHMKTNMNKKVSEDINFRPHTLKK